MEPTVLASVSQPTALVSSVSCFLIAARWSVKSNGFEDQGGAARKKKDAAEEIEVEPTR